MSSPRSDGGIYARPAVRTTLRLAAILGLGLGVETTVLHALTDPMADVRAYYDAGARLNAGAPLYQQLVDTDAPGYYRYPPLLAVAFRPLALLPYEFATLLWFGLLLVVAALTFRRLGLGEPVLLVAGWLALPFMWALTIGQAHIAVTFLLALGAPWSVALAANLKVFPALAAVFWLGRRDWRSLAVFFSWMAGLAVLQLALEPAGTLAYLGFLSFDQVGEVANISPFELSPILWAALVLVLLVAALRLAPTRYGWAAAVVLSVFATPRLLTYQLSTLLAALGGPRRSDSP